MESFWFDGGKHSPEGVITREAVGEFEVFPQPGFLGLRKALHVVKAFALTDNRSHRDKKDFTEIVLLISSATSGQATPRKLKYFRENLPHNGLSVIREPSQKLQPQHGVYKA